MYNLNFQYYGKTTIVPNKRSGIVDVNCKINVYTNPGLTTLATNDLVFSVKLIKTSADEVI